MSRKFVCWFHIRQVGPANPRQSKPLLIASGLGSLTEPIPIKKCDINSGALYLTLRLRAGKGRDIEENWWIKNEIGALGRFGLKGSNLQFIRLSFEMQFPFWGALCFPSQSCCSLQGPQFHMHCTVPIALREQVNHTTIPYAQCPLLKRNNQDSQRTRKTHHYPMCTEHIAQEEQFRFRENKNDDSQL